MTMSLRVPAPPVAQRALTPPWLPATSAPRTHGNVSKQCSRPRSRAWGTKPDQERRPRAPAAPPSREEEQFEREFLRRLQQAENEQGSSEPAHGEGQSIPKKHNGNPVARLLAAIDWSEPGSFDGGPKAGYDPLRDGPLRYLGYSNEVGEAFSAWLFRGGVPLSYAIAIGYVLYDTADKWRATGAEARVKLAAKPTDASAPFDAKRLAALVALERGVDTLVWQLLASVAIPGFTIHQVVAATTWLLQAAEATETGQRVADAVATWTAADVTPALATLNKVLPTAVGLAAIPFIVHPIDSGVHALLNATLRPAMRQIICRNGGAQAGLASCKPKGPLLGSDRPTKDS